MMLMWAGFAWAQPQVRGFPVPSYDPDNGFGIGTNLQVWFRGPGAPDGPFRSWVATQARVTTRGRVTLLARTRVGFGERWLWEGLYGGVDDVVQRFEVGPFSLPESRPVARTLAGGRSLVFHRVRRTVWVGLDHELRGARLDEEPTDVLHGLGLAVRHDTRSDPGVLRRGRLFDLRCLRVGPRLGSTLGFTEVVVDARVHRSLWGGFTTGARAWTTVRHGEVPEEAYSELGGAFVLRGLPEGRYRDRSHAVVQLELGMPLYWKLRGTAFGETGQVFGSRLGTKLAWTLGGGVHLELQEQTDRVLRMEVAVGPEGVRGLFGVGHVF